jgi:quinol monooxygenase YgiN
MILVMGHFRLPPGRLAEARPIMRRIVAETLRERGCIAYSYAEDVSDPGLIRVSEAWDSAEALSAHLTTDHMQRWCSEREELGLTDRDITRYEVAAAEKL